MKLKSTTDFVLEQNNTIPKDLNLINNYKNIVNYAKLLKKELLPEFFYSFKDEEKEKVLFDGFKIESHNSFQTVLASDNHRLIFRENSIWCSNKENTIDVVSTIEDLIGFFDFELNENFIKETKCDHYYRVGNDYKPKRCEFCGKEKVIRFFDLDGYLDKESFLLGQKANFEDKNPFEKSTNSWFNWNNGKNTNNN